jgi:7-keto-8-aminopelargonate synthetase-like enzyme
MLLETAAARYAAADMKTVSGPYPEVPKASEEIRFQVTGEHQPADIDYVIDVLKKYQEAHK